MKNSLFAACILLVGVGVFGQSTSQELEKFLTTRAASDIVQTIAANPDLGTLTTAIKAADLTNVLSQAGPFTVLAPTNEAFKRMSDIPELLKPENKEKLVALLQYHVIPSKIMAEELRDGQVITTLTGETLMVSVVNGKTRINGTELTQSNRTASNGVVHVITDVLKPGVMMGNK